MGTDWEWSGSPDNTIVPQDINLTNTSWEWTGSTNNDIVPQDINLTNTDWEWTGSTNNDIAPVTILLDTDDVDEVLAYCQSKGYDLDSETIEKLIDIQDEYQARGYNVTLSQLIEWTQDPYSLDTDTLTQLCDSAADYQDKGYNVTLDQLVEWTQDPMVKSVVDAYTGAETDAGTAFSMSSLIKSLIALTTVLQEVATAISERLNLTTDKLTAYSQLLADVPFFSDGDIDASTSERSDFNSRMSTVGDVVRSNKEVVEDKSKSIQTLLQTIKDAATQSSDYMSTFLQEILGICQKIFQ